MQDAKRKSVIRARDSTAVMLQTDNDRTFRRKRVSFDLERNIQANIKALKNLHCLSQSLLAPEVDSPIRAGS